MDKRAEFFDAVGLPDDGRSTVLLTKSEYEAFVKDKPESRTASKGSVTIYAYFVPYHDVTVNYNKSTNTVTENWFYIGE